MGVYVCVSVCYCCFDSVVCVRVAVVVFIFIVFVDVFVKYMYQSCLSQTLFTYLLELLIDCQSFHLLVYV